MAFLWFLGGFLTAVLLAFGAIALFSAGIAAGSKKNGPKKEESSGSEGVK